MIKPLSRHTGLVVLARLLQLVSLVVLYFSYPLLPALSQQISALMQGNGDKVIVYLTFTKLTAIALASIIVFIWSEIAIRMDRIRQQRLTKHASQPWLVNPKWSSGTITLSRKGAVYSFVVLMILYAVYGLPAVFVFRNETFNWILLGVVGITLWGYYNWFLLRFWASAQLQLSTFPGVIGGPFTAIFKIAKSFPKDTEFEARLQCSHLVEKGVEDTFHQREVLWGDTIRVNRQLTESHSETWIPLHFTIPFHTPSTSVAVDDANSVKWSLLVTVSNKILRGEATFEVPVFRTEDSSSDYQEDTEWNKQWVMDSSPMAFLAAHGYTEWNEVGDEKAIRLKRRHPFMLKAGLMILFFSGIGLACLISIWNYGPFVWFFALICGGLFLLAIYVLVEYALWQGDLRIRKDEIVAEAGLWGNRKRMTIKKELGSIRANNYIRTERGEMWEILLDNGQNSTIKIVRGVESQSDVESIQQYLCKITGLRAGQVT